MKRIAFLIILAASASLAQIPDSGLIFVKNAPVGKCVKGSSAEIVISTGVIYTCQAGKWGDITDLAATTPATYNAICGSGTADAVEDCEKSDVTFSSVTINSPNNSFEDFRYVGSAPPAAEQANTVRYDINAPVPSPFVIHQPVLPAAGTTVVTATLDAAGNEVEIFAPVTLPTHYPNAITLQSASVPIFGTPVDAPNFTTTARYLDASGAVQSCTWTIGNGIQFAYNQSTLIYSYTDSGTLCPNGVIKYQAPSVQYTGLISVSGFVQTPALQVLGTQFTVSGCGTSPLGGSTAGQFASTISGTCTAVITTNVNTSHGYSCWANDLTTSSNSASWSQTASTQTTITLSGNSLFGDLINFGCVAY